MFELSSLPSVEIFEKFAVENSGEYAIQPMRKRHLHRTRSGLSILALYVQMAGFNLTVQTKNDPANMLLALS
jgi:hypothetical protein